VKTANFIGISNEQVSVKIAFDYRLKRDDRHNKTPARLRTGVYFKVCCFFQVHCFARCNFLLVNRVCTVLFRCSCALLFTWFFLFPDELFFLKFTARSGLCSLIYLLPRAKQLDLSVTISRYIGLAPFSFRRMTLKWFRVSFSVFLSG
jgi:hypothetical protein